MTIADNALRDGALPLFSPAATQSLYPFQVPLRDQLLAAIERPDVRGALLELPTGGGKTTTAMSAVRIALDAGLRGAWLTHRVELINQSSARASAYGIEHGLIMPGNGAGDHPFHIASIDTLRVRMPRLKPWLAPLDFIVVDESHHSAADSWRAIVAAAPKATLLGLTATPWRLDGKPLGELFSVEIRGPSVRQLEHWGYLSAVKVVAPPAEVDLSKVQKSMGDYSARQLDALMSGEEVVSAAVVAYGQHAPGLPALAFSPGVASAVGGARAFAAAGWSVAVLESKFDPANRIPGQPTERADIIAALTSGDVQIVFQVGMAGEGTDIPVCAAGIDLAPTLSTGKYLQALGRTRRPVYAAGSALDTSERRRSAIADGTKPHAVWIDLAGNWSRHGMPNADRQWSLTEGVKGLERAVAQARRCASCHVVTERGPTHCPECGRKYRLHVVRPSAPSENELAAMPGIGPVDAIAIYNMPLGAVLKIARTTPQLVHVAKIRGYSSQWVRRILQTRGEYAALRRYG